MPSELEYYIREDGYKDSVLETLISEVGLNNRSTVGSYMRGGLYARVVDLPVDVGLERGILVDDDMNKELIRLNATKVIQTATKWTRLEGAAAILVVSDDNRLDKPLDTSNIGEIIGLKPYALSQIHREQPTYARAEDPLKEGHPKWYTLRDDYSEILVHESRLIKLTGGNMLEGLREVPWQGASVVTGTYDKINTYYCAMDYILSVLRRKQQGVYGMKGLSEALRAKLDDLVRDRIRLMDQARGITRTIAIDSEDTYKIEDLSVSGLNLVVQEFQVSVSASCGIPVTLLFGRTPGGVNSSATSELSALDGLAGDIRKNIMGPAFYEIMLLISKQKSVSVVFDDHRVVWNSLSRPTETDLSIINRSNAQAFESYTKGLRELVEAGIVSIDEAKQRLDAFVKD